MKDPKQARARPAVPGEVEIDGEELARRKAFLEFQEEDARALQDLREIARKHADPMIEDLYRHFLSFEETRSFFRDGPCIACGQQQRSFRAWRPRLLL